MCAVLDVSSQLTGAMTEELDILQMIDSAFPIGSFAHSSGLESIWRFTETSSSHKSRSSSASPEEIRRLEDYVLTILENAGTFQIPFLRNAYRCNGDWKLVAAEDQSLHVMMTNHVARRASLQQGRALASLVGTVYSSHKNHLMLCDLDKQVVSGSIHGHFAVIFGVVCNILGLDLKKSARYFLFGQLRAVIASAVRMGLLGPVKGQEMQNRLQGRLTEIVEKCLSLEYAYISSPILDIAQNAHDKLFAKLYIS